MKLFKRILNKHIGTSISHNNDSSKKNTLAFHRARPVITVSSICEIFVAAVDSGESSTCGQNGTTERCQYYGWWLKSCTASHVSYTRVGGFSLWPLNFNFGFTWKVVQDFSHSEIPMFHVLHHHNVKIEGAGKQLLTKVVQDFGHIEGQEMRVWNGWNHNLQLRNTTGGECKCKVLSCRLYACNYVTNHIVKIL